MTETTAVGSAQRSTVRTVLPGTAMIAITFGLARYGYGLLLPDMRADVQMTASTAGLVSSAAYLSYLAANIGVVAVLTRWGPRVAVGAAALLAAVGMGVIAGAHSVLFLAVGVVIAGAAAGMSFPPYADIVAGQVHPAKRDAVWATISSGTGWGVALAGPIAIVAGAQWRLAWAIFVAIALVVGALAMFHAPAAEDRRLRRPQLSITWFFCPRSRPLLLSAVLVGAGSSVWWAFSVDALRQSGVDSGPARLTYAVCGAAMLLGSLSGAMFARFGLRPTYLVSCVLLAGSLALFGLATAHLITAVVAAIVFGAVYATVIAVHGVWSSRVFEDHPSAGLAAVSTALTIGTLAGPTLAGLVIQHADYRAALVAVAFLTLAALPFSPPTARRKARIADHVCTAAPVRR
jgi:predicted MFS family arabinose efflux permease